MFFENESGHQSTYLLLMHRPNSHPYSSYHLKFYFVLLFLLLLIRCGCNVIATSEMLETCDPCAEFKRKKLLAESAGKARKA